jgi:hypothetical protein
VVSRNQSWVTLPARSYSWIPSAKAIAAEDPACRHRRHRRLTTRSPLTQALVWPRLLVVLGEFAENVLQVATARDQ